MKQEMENINVESFNKLKNLLLEEYKDVKDEDVQYSYCPYRICPVGAHIDHQKGIVTGFALDRGVEIAYIPSKSNFYEVTSLNFKGRKGGSLYDIPPKSDDWADYIRGTIKILRDEFDIKKGVFAIIKGSLPIGGLSSSASLIISFMRAVCNVNGLQLSKKDVIKLARKVENEYIGVKVGILDQSCELYSRKDNLLYLDTKTENYELYEKPKNMKDFKIAVIFSGITRTLKNTSYNTRVDELKSASYALKAFAGIECGSFSDSVLRDVEKEVFLKYFDKLPKNWYKRAKHYYDEIDRVKRAVDAWKEGNIEKFAKISSESGRSSIYNYEAGSNELKEICNIINSTDGVYGGRFSGAGFKGCCIAFVDPAKENKIREEITKRYLKKFPKYNGIFEIFFCDISDGIIEF